jgi:hypothetical protein
MITDTTKDQMIRRTIQNSVEESAQVTLQSLAHKALQSA